MGIWKQSNYDLNGWGIYGLHEVHGAVKGYIDGWGIYGFKWAGQLWQSELLLSGDILRKLLVRSLLLLMSPFSTRRHVSGHNLMRQAKWLLANTKGAGCSKKVVQFYPKAYTERSSPIFCYAIHCISFKAVHPCNVSLVKTSDRQKTHKIFRLTFLHFFLQFDGLLYTQFFIFMCGTV